MRWEKRENKIGYGHEYAYGYEEKLESSRDVLNKKLKLLTSGTLFVSVYVPISMPDSLAHHLEV